MPKHPVEHEPFVFISACPRWQETAFHEGFRPVLLIRIESQDAVVDDLHNVAQRRRVGDLSRRRQRAVSPECRIETWFWKTRRLP